MALAIDLFKTVSEPVHDSFLEHLENEDAERQQKYRELREYYEGIHETQLTARMRTYLQLKAHDEFSANYMPIVVDGMSARMTVDGFDAGEQGEVLAQWWAVNRMDANQDDTHTEAIRDGDSYVMVGWDNVKNVPKFYPHMAYDGRDGMHVVYDTETSEIAFAVKRWLIEGGLDAGYKRRMNIYTPDRILRYHSNQEEEDGHWILFQTDLWEAQDGSPLGVPIVHFKNRGRGYSYGQSELEQAIPMQNALNKTVIDLLAAADTTAFRVLYMIGADPSGLEISPGGWVYMMNPPAEGKIGWIPGEDLRPMIEVVDSFVQRIGQVSDTPLSYFQLSGQMASEGTHKQHESRMITKVKKASVKFGNSWEDVMAIARRLHNTFGSGSLSEEQAIDVRWADFSARDEDDRLSDRIERFKVLVDAGVAPYEAAKKAGFSEKDAVDLAKVDLFNAQQ